MQRVKTFLIVIAVLLLAASCVTVKDLQRSTDLIRTDNELTRLLTEVRPSDPGDAATYLLALASHAENEAAASQALHGKQADAIAYYRIAATAFWRSGQPAAVSDLFRAADSGIDLCTALGEKSPDRDCLFLRLVIPFAGLESIAGEKLSEKLEPIDFSDNQKTAEEIETLQSVQESLTLAKGPIETILAIGEDDRLLSHTGMQRYYCDNARKAERFFTSTAGLFVTKVRGYEMHRPGNSPSFAITVEDARELRQLSGTVPGFCK